MGGFSVLITEYVQNVYRKQYKSQNRYRIYLNVQNTVQNISVRVLLRCRICTELKKSLFCTYSVMFSYRMCTEYSTE
jgi:hypothetical protein